MIISVDLKPNDLKRLKELKTATELPTQSEVIRTAIRELHKNFLPQSLSMDRKMFELKGNRS